MKEVILHFKKLDWWLFLSALFLVIFGLISIYSSSFSRGNFLNFQKQLIFLLVGIFLMLILSFFDWRAIKEDRFLIFSAYLILILALFGLYFLGVDIRGAQKWYRIGPFLLDPVEFLKIVLILILAKYFSKKHVELYTLWNILFSGIYVFLPTVLIFFQPDFGSAAILIILWIGMLLVSGIRVSHFLCLVLIFSLFFLICWSYFFKDYQKARILNFLFPSDPLGVGWSQNQAKIAIGSGGFLGKGFKKGPQTQYKFLPEPQTDFIFAAIAEEFGFLGTTFLFFLFLLLIWRAIKIASLSRSNFARLFAIGFGILVISQVFINVGMNLGILPIVGIPLPFVSYGGSSLIAHFLGLGFLQSIKTH